MIAAVAVIVMCAAGLVGAGYAYTASTTNDGNNASSEYLVLSQDGPGAYTFVNKQAIYYDTVNRKVDGAVGTAYTLAGDTIALDINNDSTDDYTAVKLGNDLTLAADQTGGYHEDLTCTVALTGTKNIPDDCVIILKADTEKAATADQYIVYDGTDWTPESFTIYANANTEYYDTTVQIYFGYAVGTTLDEAPNAALLTDVTLTFSAARALNNHFIVDFTNEAVNAAMLSTVTYKVYDNAGNELTLGTHYTAAWKSAAGAALTPAETAIATGTEYVLVITGVADTVHEGKVTEFRITGVAAA